MARRSKRPASRGSVNNLILKALTAGDKYGYEIIKQVEEESEGKIILKQPSLYSSLSRFETKGFVSSYWEDSDIGGRRHYYSLTPTGKDHYNKFVLKDDDESAEDVIDEIEEETDDDSDGIYDYDQKTEEEKIDNSLSKYNFNVQDKINELLKEDTIDNSDNVEPITEEEPEQYIEMMEDEIEQLEQIGEDVEEPQQENFEKINDIETPSYPVAKTLIDTPLKEESKSARDQLKEIYNSIVNSNKHISPKKEEPVTIRPLTSEELQRRKESMQILYGDYKLDNTQENKTLSESNIDPVPTQSKKEKLFQTSEYQELVKASNQIAKKNNIPITKSNIDPVIEEKPKKRFVVDEFGIMKIAEDIPEKEQKVFDNVGYRTTNSGHNVVEYKPQKPITKTQNNGTFATSKPLNDNIKTNTNEVELSDEERAIRQERFNERFANLQKERFEQRDSKIENIINQENDSPVYDGRPPTSFSNKNVRLFKDLNENNEQIDPIISDDEEYGNNINEELENIRSTAIKTNLDNNDNSILDLQKELINKGVEFKSYSKESTIRKEHDFILHNKLKFALGFILLFLMAIETTILLFVSKNMGFYLTDNKILFIGAYSIIGIISASLIIPFIVSPNKRKISNFKFGTNFIFGLFAFILTAILTYGLNVLAGFTLDNINYYLTSLILPVVLAFNFIIVPFIYNLLLKTKAFY